MTRQTVRAAMPSIYEPIGHDKTGEPIYLPEVWRRFLEDVYTALFFQGTDPTKAISTGGIILGTGTTGDYVEDITSGTGVTVTGGTGEGSNPTVQIGQAVGTTDSPTFAALTITGTLDADTLEGQNSAFHLDRANHTGAQAISTVTNLQTDLDGKVSKTTGITDASVAHALNATFSDTEVEAALDALGAKVNEVIDALNA